MLQLIIKAASVCATLAMLYCGLSQAHAKTILDDGNTSKVYLAADGKQISPADAYAQALSNKDVLECAHMDIKINVKTGKPSLVKAK